MATRIRDSRHERRLAILGNPTETLRIECKSWLDLSDNHSKAVIAKAAMALANSGGGIIVFGVTEDNSAGGRLTFVPRPAAISRYTSDAIGSAINKYADPDIDFILAFESHRETGEEHAFVEVEGGMLQPVFAKKSFNGVIKKLACYIRKPGPKSEVPHTAQEWRDLMTRCVRANQDSMLDSIRTIMDGRPLDTTPTPSEEDQLREFMRESKERWQERLQEVDEDDVARLKHGYWAFAFSILGVPDWSSLIDLRENLRCAALGSYSRILFEQDTTPGLAPYAADGAIEAWTGNPTPVYSRSSPYRCAFWRATERGEFHHLLGFLEDSEYSRAEPGTRHFLDLSIELHAKMLKLAASIAKSVGEDTEIVISSEFTGLKGRYLSSSQAWWGALEGDPMCSIPAVELPPRRITPQQIDDNLTEILYDFLYPLYEKFNFYELKRGWVESAVEAVKSDGW